MEVSRLTAHDCLIFFDVAYESNAQSRRILDHLNQLVTSCARATTIVASWLQTTCHNRSFVAHLPHFVCILSFLTSVYSHLKHPRFEVWLAVSSVGQHEVIFSLESPLQGLLYKEIVDGIHFFPFLHRTVALL